MSTSAEIQKILQEVFILATGNAASQEEIDWLATLQGAGDWQPLRNAINSYMSEMATSKGLVATLKMLAKNGVGVQLSDAEANSIAALLQDGSLTWDGLFEIVVASTTPSGQTLTNRGEAAYQFLADLAQANKSSYYQGAAVYQAVSNLIQGISASSQSLANAMSGLQTLIAKLTSAGIPSTVIDGYIKGATVFVDANGDGQLSPGEFSTTTDAGGNYLLPANVSGGKIIAFGGTDIMTGKPYPGVLTAPAGSLVVNPLSTLIQALVDQGATVAEAKATLSKSLGLPENINLLVFDPLTVLADPTANAAAKEMALAVQATALQISNIIAQVGTAINGAAGTVDLATAAGAVMTALATALAENPEGLDLAHPETLAAIVTTAATEAGASDLAAMAGDLAAITANINAAVANATSITELAQVAVVAQDNAINAILDGLQNGDLATALKTFTDPTQLAALINEAEVGELVPGVVIPPEVIENTVSGKVEVSFANAGATIQVAAAQDGKLTFTSNGTTRTTVAAATNIAEIRVGAGKTLSGAADVLHQIKITGDGSANITGADGDQELEVLTTGNNTIAGGAGNDTITGGGGNDSINGGDGNDTIDGGAGNDVIDGGAGNDTIIGGLGDDSIDGGAGNDVIDGGAGNDTIIGGLGDDTIDGGDGVDTLNLLGDIVSSGDVNLNNLSNIEEINIVNDQTDNNTLTLTLTSNVTTTTGQGSLTVNINGGASKVAVAYGAGSTEGAVINGSTGNDTITGGAKADTIDGGAGNDSITGGAGNDTIIGGAGNDTIDGGAGNDSIDGGDGNDTIIFSAGNGNDTIDGGNGTDTLLVGAAPTAALADNQLVNIENIVITAAGDFSNVTKNQTEGFNISVDSTVTGNVTIDVTSSTGNNTITGGAGNDTITGGAGNDTITGGAGNDSITGGAGNDSIDGGAGADVLTGGDGADTFVFAAGSGGAVRTAFNDEDSSGTITDNDTIVFAGAIDVITSGDFVSGTDKIDVTAANNLTEAEIGTTATNVTFSENDIFAVRGDWNSDNNTFTVSNTGADTLVLYNAANAAWNDNAQNTANYVVLLGVTTIQATDFV